MRRGILFLLCTALAPAQDRQVDPFERAVQSYQAARAQGSFGEAAARREEAHALLVETRVDSPQFANRVQQTQQLYQNSGRRAQARAVVQEAVARAKSLGDSHPIRIQLLNMLADSWQSDGNLLKALVHREQALAALEAAPPGSTQAAVYANLSGGQVARTGLFSRISSWQPIAGIPFQYQQLAELYRQLGRPDAAARVMAKVPSLILNDPKALAAFYGSQGNFDEAVKLYRKQSEQAAVNPQAQIWEVVGPLQSIAALYQRQERWDDAAAALGEAASRMEASGTPQAFIQAVNIRLNLANLLQQAGRTQNADQVYQTLFSESSNETQAQVLQAYADHLSTTNRAGQGEQLLRTYLAGHSDLQPWQETNLLSALARAAGGAGHNTLADEYRRAVKEKQSALQPPQKSDRPMIGPDVEKASAAVNAGHLDEGVSLASQAIASASVAQDGEQISWQVPSIASILATKLAADKGERLYQELLAQLQARSVDNMSPLLQALQQYVRFLIGQKNRWAEVPGMLDRYRDAVIAAYGPDTSEFNQAIILRSDFAGACGAPIEAEHAAEGLLTREASLSGVTSEPYMNAAQTAAGIYESTKRPEHALELRLQVVTIADQALASNDARRAFARMNAANALIGVRQLDAAERLAMEAVAMAEQLRGVQQEMFIRQLDQIRKMKAEAVRRAARESGSAPRR